MKDETPGYWDKQIAEQGIAQQEKAKKAEELLLAHPFNPRIEVSADAKYITKHLWIIFVLLPFVVGLLYWLTKQ